MSNSIATIVNIWQLLQSSWLTIYYTASLAWSQQLDYCLVGLMVTPNNETNAKEAKPITILISPYTILNNSIMNPLC